MVLEERAISAEVDQIDPVQEVGLVDRMLDQG
jgi:hypothetical protein